MQALTFWPVWGWLVVHGPKDIENRTWFNVVVSELMESREPFAIHTAAQQTQATYDWAVRVTAEVSPGIVLPARKDLVLGAVIGMAKIWRVVAPARCPRVEDRWHLPSTDEKKYYGWCLDERQAFQHPIPAKGKQGFWRWDRNEKR